MTGGVTVARAVLALRSDGQLAPALRCRIADQLEALAAEVAQLRRRAGEGGTVEWSPELDARVLALLAEGLSYRVVAVRLSAETGRTISKDAVVGRAHRLKAPPRPSPIRAADPCKRQSGQDRRDELLTGRAPLDAESTAFTTDGAPEGALLLVQGASCDVHVHEL